MADYDDRRRDRDEDWERRRDFDTEGDADYRRESGTRPVGRGQSRDSESGRASNWPNRGWGSGSGSYERGRTPDEEYYRNFGSGQDYGSDRNYGSQSSGSGQGYRSGQGYGAGERYRSGQGWNSDQGYGTSDTQGSYGRHSPGSVQGQTGRGRSWGRGPRGYARSDDRIQEDVNDRLTWHGDIDATNIQVAVQNGEVTLEGRVEDRHQKRMAEDVAAEVWGVKDVHNRIKVDQSLGEQIREGIDNLTGNKK
ncbi:MAG: BON domain-containing protein [Chloroflexi bacterium]|nr:BON domain-containing protein [Chloroflexota bacterium]